MRSSAAATEPVITGGFEPAWSRVAGRRAFRNGWVAGLNLVVIALTLLLGGSGRAEASFPGRNGALAVELDTCELAPSIRLVSMRGEQIGRVTPSCQLAPGAEDFRSTSLHDWSPDGALLLIQQAGVQPSGLVTLAPDGSGAQAVALRNDGLDEPDASLAPDGRQIAYLRNGSVWRGAIDGTDKRKLLAQPKCNLDVRDCVEFEGVEWSPDGRLITVEVLQNGWGSGGRPRIRPGIWLISADTGGLIRRLAKNGFDVDWSPDSRRLVYRTAYVQHENGKASGGNIWVVDVDGGRAQRIVHRERFAEIVPTWSPDGRWIAWISLRFGAGDVEFSLKPSLWLVRARGGPPRHVKDLPRLYVEEGFYDEPNLSWQPLPSP